MLLRILSRSFLFLVLLLSAPLAASAQGVALKDLGRFDGWRSNPLVGQGLVVGLSGSGDSRRSGVTRQALRNVLGRFGTTLTEDDLTSRNVAAVMITAELPPSANVGDRIPVSVSSIGDARSLAGGVLLMTELMGPDGRPYALAQGPLIAGGYSFESQLNVQRRNYPTTVRLEEGATVEASVEAGLIQPNGNLSFILADPSYTTAKRIEDTINSGLGNQYARAIDADRVEIAFSDTYGALPGFVSLIEGLRVLPDRQARIVINERTGTIVAGGNVVISSVTISQGDLEVSVVADNFASQPAFVGGIQPGVSSLIVTNTDLSVEQGASDIVKSLPDTSVADLARTLNEAGVDTRRMISILQAMKAAGAIHADIIVQ